MKKLFVIMTVPFALYGCGNQVAEKIKMPEKVENKMEETMKEDTTCRQSPDGKWMGNCDATEMKSNTCTGGGKCEKEEDHAHEPGTPEHDDNAPVVKESADHHEGEENVAPHRE